MPHTNVSTEPQKVFTKQRPKEPMLVMPGETISGEAMRTAAIESDKEFDMLMVDYEEREEAAAKAAEDAEEAADT